MINLSSSCPLSLRMSNSGVGHSSLSGLLIVHSWNKLSIVIEQLHQIQDEIKVFLFFLF